MPLFRKSSSNGPNCTSPGSDIAPRPTNCSQPKESTSLKSGDYDNKVSVEAGGEDNCASLDDAMADDDNSKVDKPGQNPEVHSNSSSPDSETTGDAITAESHDDEAAAFVQYDFASSSPLRSCSSEPLSAASSRSVCCSSNSPPQIKNSQTHDFLRMALRKSLTTFFEKHDKEFLPNIDSLVSQYFGKSQTIEEDINSLYDFVHNKYNERPSAIILGSGMDIRGADQDVNDDNIYSRKSDDGSSNENLNCSRSNSEKSAVHMENSSGSNSSGGHSIIKCQSADDKSIPRSEDADEQVDNSPHDKATPGNTQVAPWNADYDPNFHTAGITVSGCSFF